MSELVVIGFEDREEADRVLVRLAPLQKEYLLDLKDAVVVTRDEKGKVHIKQSVNMGLLGTSTGLVEGALFGTLIGLLFLNPLGGFAIGSLAGAAAGGISGALSDYGIDDKFIKSLGETIPVNSSALFMLIHKVQPEKVAELQKALSGVKR